MSNEMKKETKTIDLKLANAIKSVYDSLTDEQRKKAKACETQDELLAFLGREGVELQDDLLDNVSGGLWPMSSDDWPEGIFDPESYKC